MLTHAAKPYFYPGGFGVDVFFVLSGFLITTLLWQEAEQTGRIRFSTFYLKRAIRLYPALLTTIIVTIIASQFLGVGMAAVLRDSVAAASYLTPFSVAVFGDAEFYGHLWTLAVEEYFYLVWPVALYVMRRIGLRWQTLAGLSIAGGSALYLLRIAGGVLLGADLPYLRVGGIAIGCGIALIIYYSGSHGGPSLLSAAAVAGLIAAALCSELPRMGSLAYPLAAASAVAAVFVVMGPTRGWIQRVLELKPLVFFGKVSYEVYLIHVLCLLGLALVTGLQRYAIWPVAYPIAVLAASAMHYGYKPLQDRLRGVLKRGKGATA